MIVGPTDREGILALHARSANAADAKDGAGWVDTFTRAGVFETPGYGRFEAHDALTRFFDDFVATTVESQGRHILSNVEIEVDGDAARSYSYFQYFRTTAGVTELVMLGTYRDEMVREGDRWLFTSRLVSID